MSLAIFAFPEFISKKKRDLDVLSKNIDINTYIGGKNGI